MDHDRASFEAALSDAKDGDAHASGRVLDIYDTIAAELSHIDAVLARRPALAELESRRAKVEHAITVAAARDAYAGEVSGLAAQNKQLRAERDAAVGEVDAVKELAASIAKPLSLRLAALTTELERIREREAACCPEDVPFDEHIAALTADNARLRVALEQIQWGPQPIGARSNCPWCLNDKVDGHSDDCAVCAVRAALAPREMP